MTQSRKQNGNDQIGMGIIEGMTLVTEGKTLVTKGKTLVTKGKTLPY